VHGKITAKTRWVQVIIVLSTLICKSGDTVIAILVLYILLAARKLYKKKLKFITPYIILVSNLFFTFVLVIVGSTEILNNLFIKFLGKNIKSVRFRIWENYLKQSCASPIIGNGYLKVSQRYNLVGASHAHNMYLDVFFIGGIVGLFLFLLIIYVSLHRKNKNITIYQEIMLYTVGAYMIAFQATARTYCPTFFILLAFSTVINSMMLNANYYNGDFG
jgi:O-antigen ligase